MIKNSHLLEYTEEQKAEIKKRVNQALYKSLEVNKYGQGCPMWMNILFLLDRFNSGKYYGTIEIKVLGTSVNDAKEKEKTHKMREIYPDVI